MATSLKGGGSGARNANKPGTGFSGGVSLQATLLKNRWLRKLDVRRRLDSIDWVRLQRRVTLVLAMLLACVVFAIAVFTMTIASMKKAKKFERKGRGGH